jgi:hypothetical protein
LGGPVGEEARMAGTRMGTLNGENVVRVYIDKDEVVVEKYRQNL